MALTGPQGELVGARIEIDRLRASRHAEGDTAKPTIPCRNKSITRRPAVVLRLRIPPGPRALALIGTSTARRDKQVEVDTNRVGEGLGLGCTNLVGMPSPDGTVIRREV
jgi:hypothetical protein